jgi:hypothetical protein
LPCPESEITLLRGFKERYFSEFDDESDELLVVYFANVKAGYVKRMNGTIVILEKKVAGSTSVRALVADITMHDVL